MINKIDNQPLFSIGIDNRAFIPANSIEEIIKFAKTVNSGENFIIMEHTSGTLYLLVLEKCYYLYKSFWCENRGIKLENIDEDIGINGECYVCKEEFEDNEFKDEKIMEKILISQKELYDLWYDIILNHDEDEEEVLKEETK